MKYFRRRPVCVESKESKCTRRCNKHIKKKQVTCKWTLIIIRSGVALHFASGFLFLLQTARRNISIQQVCWKLESYKYRTNKKVVGVDWCALSLYLFTAGSKRVEGESGTNFHSFWRPRLGFEVLAQRYTKKGAI